MNRDLLDWWDGDEPGGPGVSNNVNCAHKGAAARTGVPAASARSNAAVPPLPGGLSRSTHSSRARLRSRHRPDRPRASRTPEHISQPRSAAHAAAAANRAANRAFAGGVARQRSRATNPASAPENWTRPLSLADLAGLGVRPLATDMGTARTTAQERELRVRPERETEMRSSQVKRLRDSRRAVAMERQASHIAKVRHEAIFPNSGDWRR